MIEEPTCYTRQCAFFEGVKWLGDGEHTEVAYCKAFPGGIPNDIAFGQNKHLKPVKGQDSDIVFKNYKG